MDATSCLHAQRLISLASSVSTAYDLMAWDRESHAFTATTSPQADNAFCCVLGHGHLVGYVVCKISEHAEDWDRQAQHSC